jgi:hypothetical protein
MSVSFHGLAELHGVSFPAVIVGLSQNMEYHVDELVAQWQERGGVFWPAGVRILRTQYFVCVWDDPHTLPTLIKMSWVPLGGLVFFDHDVFYMLSRGALLFLQTSLTLLPLAHL